MSKLRVLLTAALVFSGTAVLGAIDLSALFTLSSDSFTDHQKIPLEYACEQCGGENLSPAFHWSHIPEETRSLALVCIHLSPDKGEVVHWIVYNIPPSIAKLPEGIQRSSKLRNGIMQGTNDYGHVGYDGPVAVPDKPNRYVFTLYALNSKLDLPPKATYNEFSRAIKGHIISQTEILSRFKGKE